ncbi:MAG: enoyl-CoA hydratase/isomerase family protein [Micromonosporaceae bacterium]|nr:enoyl-CoA hydratase/isomerase family protein [Micromonosporaceae bacterium]
MSGLSRTDRDGVAWLALDRPDRRNALTIDLLRDLRATLVSIQDDPAVRVVVLSGAGEAFCAGADLKEFGPAPHPGQRLARLRLVAQVLSQIRELEQPTIAAVNGPALGAGWGLALACDLCFAVSGATFCLPEVAKGYRLPSVLVHRLSQVVGPVRAAEIMLGAATYDTEQAVTFGWVSRVLPDRQTLTEQTWRFAVELAARARPALAAAIQPLRRDPTREPSPPAEYAWIEE